MAQRLDPKDAGAAALWALMDCGIVDALPDRDCPGLSSAELIAAARETTERAPAADARTPSRACYGTRAPEILRRITDVAV